MSMYQNIAGSAAAVAVTYFFVVGPLVAKFQEAAATVIAVL